MAPAVERARHLVLVTKYPPLQGGTSISAYVAAHDLAAVGWRVTVLTCARYEYPWTRATPSQVDEDAAVSVIDVSPPWRIDHVPADRPLFSLLFGACTALLRDDPADLVIGWYLEPFGIAAGMAARAAGAPYLLAHAGSDIVRLGRDVYLREAYASVAADARAVLTKPPMEAQVRACVGPRARLEQLGPDPLPSWFRSADRNLAPAVCPDEYVAAFADGEREMGRELVAAKPERARRHLSLGKASPRRPLAELAAALPRTETLTLATGGPPHFMSSLIAQLGSLPDDARGAVSVRPFVPAPSVPVLMRSHEVLWSLDGDHDVATHFSRVPMQALLCERPLVVSAALVDRTPYPDLFQDGRTCLVLKTRSTEALREAFTRMRDGDLRAELAARGAGLARAVAGTLPTRHPIVDIVGPA